VHWLNLFAKFSVTERTAGVMITVIHYVEIVTCQFLCNRQKAVR